MLPEAPAFALCNPGLNRGPSRPSPVKPEVAAVKRTSTEAEMEPLAFLQEGSQLWVVGLTSQQLDDFTLRRCSSRANDVPAQSARACTDGDQRSHALECSRQHHC